MGSPWNKYRKPNPNAELRASLQGGSSPLALVLRIEDWVGVVNFKGEIVAQREKPPVWASGQPRRKGGAL